MKSGILILTTIYLSSQMVILYFLFHLPNPLSALWLQLTFSPEHFRTIISGWSSEQLSLYLNHYYLDFIHPFIYGNLLIALLKTLKTPPPKAFYTLPVLGGLGDEVENICDLFLILNQADFSRLILWTGATASWMKWTFLLITLMIFSPIIQQKIIKK